MDRSLDYTKGRLELTDGWLTLYRGRRRVAAIPRSSIRTATVEERTSFRHPLLGAVFAVALLVPSVGVLVAILAWGNLGALVFLRLGVAVLFGIGLGSWLLYDLLTSPRICWLRIGSQSGVHWLALPGVSRPELEELAAALTPAGGESAPA
jgi:hypothetical protein